MGTLGSVSATEESRWQAYTLSATNLNTYRALVYVVSVFQHKRRDQGSGIRGIQRRYSFSLTPDPCPLIPCKAVIFCLFLRRKQYILFPQQILTRIGHLYMWNDKARDNDEMRRKSTTISQNAHGADVPSTASMNRLQPTEVCAKRGCFCIK